MSIRDSNFRGRSLLGAAVALFLVYGTLNAFGAIYVPVTLHTGGPWSIKGMVLSEHADRAMLGEELARLTDTNTRLWSFEVAFMDTMCAYMMAYAILNLAVAWFALRRGQVWSLWALLVAGLAVLPYYAAIAFLYATYGVRLAESLPPLLFPWLLIPIAATFGALG